MLRYNGAGPNFARLIIAPFDDDPDWADPSVPRPDEVCWLMDYGVYVPRRAVLTFAFFNAGGAEVSGGTANMYEFHVMPATAFFPPAGAPTDAPGCVRKGETVVAADLAKVWVMTNVGPVLHGIRLSAIQAPPTAAVLKISVMELPRQ